MLKKLDPRSWTALIAGLLHLAVLLCFLHYRSSYVAPMRLPGDRHGSAMVLTYLPGHMAPAAPQKPAKPLLQAKLVPKMIAPRPAVSQVMPPSTQQAAVTHPDATPGLDALGDGDINIALLSYFPDPKPDLSALPPGTAGDVILNAVIGEDGRIRQLQLMKGLGHGIDESVIATVQQWTYHPATRDGKPIASEQEIHFHYERA